MRDYLARLAPVLEFAERKEQKARYRVATRIDRDFAIALKGFLVGEYKTTRNGRPGGQLKSLSMRQVFNILECLRTCLNWALLPAVRKMPADWVSPFTRDIVGDRPRKSRVRPAKLPIDERTAMVRAMDLWQLCQLSLSLVLTMRPDELTAILISDINWTEGVLNFGSRMGGGDFNKAKQDFLVPFPRELHPILIRCIGDRVEGPLLRTRQAFDGQSMRSVNSFSELCTMYEAELAKSRPEDVDTEQDRKGVFRRVLSTIGGVSPTQLAREFQLVRKAAGLTEHVKFYESRHTASTDMHRAGVPHLDLTFMTGHTTRDILNEYVGLEPTRAIGKYFTFIRPLLTAIANRAHELGITDDDNRVAS